jgi:hypothetical protein
MNLAVGDDIEEITPAGMRNLSVAEFGVLIMLLAQSSGDITIHFDAINARERAAKAA